MPERSQLCLVSPEKDNEVGLYFIRRYIFVTPTLPIHVGTVTLKNVLRI